MSTQAVAAIGPQIAGVSVSIEVQSNCEQLDKKNEENREKVKEKLEAMDKTTKEQALTLEKAKEGGMTFSSISAQLPAATQTLSAASSGTAQTSHPDGLVVGGTSEQMMGGNRADREANIPELKEKAGILCDQYVHPGGGKGAHAEPKLFNELTNSLGESAMRGGTVLLNIDWRFFRGGKVQRSGMPCRSCYTMLCHAAQECDMDVYICDKDGQAQPLSENKDDCQSEDGWRKLCKRVDGNLKPGR